MTVRVEISTVGKFNGADTSERLVVTLPFEWLERIKVGERIPFDVQADAIVREVKTIKSAVGMHAEVIAVSDDVMPIYRWARSDMCGDVSFDSFKSHISRAQPQ